MELWDPYPRGDGGQRCPDVGKLKPAEGPRVLRPGLAAQTFFNFLKIGIESSTTSFFCSAELPFQMKHNFECQTTCLNCF